MPPEFRRFLFRRSPLRLVVGQVRFPVLAQFGEGSFIAGFQRAIRSEYPRADRASQVTFQVSPKGVQPGAGENLWKFASRDNEATVVLGEAALTLEMRAYTSIGDFLGRFRGVLQAAMETLDLTERVRLGFRYVNEIRRPNSGRAGDVLRLIRPDLAGFICAPPIVGQVEHAFQEVRFRLSEGTLAVRHGLLTGTAVEPRPQEPPPTGPFYLIDLDCHDPTECELDIARTIAQMEAYNDIMYRFFYWTLTDELFEMLEGEECASSKQ